MPKYLKTACDWAISLILSHLVAFAGVGGLTASSLSVVFNAPTWAVVSIGMSSAALIIAIFTLLRVRSVLPNQPMRADIERWSSVGRLQLSEAACLWEEIEPHKPIIDQRVRVRLHLLKEAIENDKLVRRRSLIERALDEQLRSDDGTVSVSDHDKVDVVELARYADSTGRPRPAFLRDVDVPVDDGDRQHLSSSSQ